MRPRRWRRQDGPPGARRAGAARSADSRGPGRVAHPARGRLGRGSRSRSHGTAGNPSRPTRATRSRSCASGLPSAARARRMSGYGLGSPGIVVGRDGHALGHERVPDRRRTPLAGGVVGSGHRVGNPAEARPGQAARAEQRLSVVPEVGLADRTSCWMDPVGSATA